ncbi:MAG: hypothetical protein AAGM21_05350 [Pseudomonadota bacterium]
MNANRLINMVLRMVMRKGVRLAARRMGGSKGQGLQSQGRQTAKLARQANRLNRRL